LSSKIYSCPNSIVAAENNIAAKQARFDIMDVFLYCASVKD
jgi:hypothetical protein